MATYKGFNERVGRGGFLVTKDGQALSPGKSQKVWNHSPNGFNWGYGGSGPAQLALALLLEETDKDTAVRLYQRFKWEVVAPIPLGFESSCVSEAWELTSGQIQNWLKRQPGLQQEG
ncbi:MAG: DUF6166 domain-containing protein [Dehalococcoidales bacterium]|nr:DUF6166 domain-containing protein [Dehalococcoidales bacterium]